MAIEYGNTSDLLSSPSSFSFPSSQGVVYGDTSDLGPEYFDNPKSGKAESGQILPFEKKIASLPLGPTLVGLYGAAVEVGQAAAHMIPYGKYALPKEREKFMGMSEEEQREALLWDAAEAVAFAWFPRAGGDLRSLGKFALAKVGGEKTLVGKALKGGGKVIEGVLAADVNPLKWKGQLKKGLEVGRLKGVDFEAKPFLYEEALGGYLRKKGFAKEEVEGIVKAMTGGGDEGLSAAVAAREGVGKKATKGFEKVTKLEGEVRQLTSAFREQAAEPLVRAAFNAKQFEKAISKVSGDKASGLTRDALFSHFAERKFGEVGKKLTLATSGDVEMKGVIGEMLGRRAEARAALKPGMGYKQPSQFQPSRVTFGTGEALYGTYSNIYEKVQLVSEVANTSKFDWGRKWLFKGEELGLWKVLRRGKKGVADEVGKAPKLINPTFTEEEQNLAYEVLRESDNLSGLMRRAKDPEEVARLKGRFAMNERRLSGQPNAWKLAHLWRGFSDEMYGSYLLEKVPQIFAKAGLSAEGKRAVSLRLAQVEERVKTLFSGNSGANPAEKMLGGKELLAEVRGLLDEPGVERLFEVGGDKEALKKVTQLLKERLTPGEGKANFLPYHQNYLARIINRGDGIQNSWKNQLYEGMRPSSFKKRQKDIFTEEAVDFSTMIEQRISAQANELYLYPGLEEVVTFTKQLPPAWVEVTEHYLSRVLGRPSHMDALAASVIENTAGAVSRGVASLSGGRFGGEGLWNESRVQRLGQDLNNLQYMSALGFKPSAAIRNFFQPLLTVVADLGGLRDIGTLASGWRRIAHPVSGPTTIRILDNMKIVTDYAPELTGGRIQALPFGKPKFLGIDQKTVEGARDVGNWMFSGADKLNRYVTGSAALTKWEKGLARVGGRLDTSEARSRFAKVMKFSGRHPWMQAKIEDSLARGKTYEAMETYVKDVVADTQYLYGKLDAPIVTGKSAVGRTGWIFQTWWMNYGALLEKWAMTGDAGLKANRLFAAMTTAAIGYAGMRALWGHNRASKSVGLGPLPGKIGMPPMWKPVYDFMATLANLQNPELSSQHAVELIGSIPSALPAGYQLRSTIKDTAKEGFPGFLKSIIQYKGWDG